MQICQDVIKAQYVLGIQNVQRFYNSVEFKLFGNPWRRGTDGHDGIHGRNLICHLFHALARRNWIPVVSADVSAKYETQKYGDDFPVDTDSIFFTCIPAATV